MDKRIDLSKKIEIIDKYFNQSSSICKQAAEALKLSHNKRKPKRVSKNGKRTASAVRSEWGY